MSTMFSSKQLLLGAARVQMAIDLCVHQVAVPAKRCWMAM
jgi:hypothetical protein